MQPKKTDRQSAAGDGENQEADAVSEKQQDSQQAKPESRPASTETITWEGPAAESAADDRLLRMHAEMQNLRSRTSREIADERRYAALPILRDLLPVIDNINRAIEAAEKAGEADNLLAGFRLVKQQLETILSRHEAEPIAGEGEPFDPHFQEAILQQPSADVPSGHVTMVTLPGYKLHDRVVRPAQVIISSGPSS